MIQAESISMPGETAFAAVAQSMQIINEGVPLSQTEDKLFSVEEWKNWMPEGSHWSFGFNKDKVDWWDFGKNTQIGSGANRLKTANFFASGGMGISIDDYPIFLPNSLTMHEIK